MLPTRRYLNTYKRTSYKLSSTNGGFGKGIARGSKTPSAAQSGMKLNFFVKPVMKSKIKRPRTKSYSKEISYKRPSGMKGHSGRKFESTPKSRPQFRGKKYSGSGK